VDADQWPYPAGQHQRCRHHHQRYRYHNQRSGIGTPPADTIVIPPSVRIRSEAYGLKITPQRITVSASSAAGLFYGAVTLWQLLPPGGAGEIPAQTIRDAPAYALAGADARFLASFFSLAAFIRSMIDWMACTSSTVLHWHLTAMTGLAARDPQSIRA